MEMKPQLKSGLRWTCEAADLVYCAMCACVTWICLDYSITANPATVQVEDDSPQSRHPSSINFFSSVVVILCREREADYEKKGTWAFWYYTRLLLVCTVIYIFLKISLIFFIHSVQLIYSELVKKSIISCSLYWGFFFLIRLMLTRHDQVMRYILYWPKDQIFGNEVYNFSTT